ncbi:hypothetical protein EV2_006967 [Malus domestica]
MSMPINNKEDLEAFMEAHRDVLGGCHLELERHNIDIRSKLALIIGSDPAKYLHSYVAVVHDLLAPINLTLTAYKELPTKDKDYDCDALIVIGQWEGNINDPRVAVKPTASMTLSDPTYEVNWDEPKSLKDVVKKCPDKPIKESISDYEEMENVDKAVEVENKGLNKSVSPSRVPTTSESVQPVIKPELIEIGGDKQVNPEDEMPFRKRLRTSSRNMPTTTRLEVVDSKPIGILSVTVRGVAEDVSGNFVVSVNENAENNELKVKAIEFSQMEDFLKQQMVETRKVCEDEAHDETHGLKEKLT